MNWQNELEQLIAAVPSAEYAALVGELARHQAQLMLPVGPRKNLAAPQDFTERDRLLTVCQVADQLGMSKDWVYRHQRELGTTHTGRSLRFRQSAVSRYLTRGNR